MSQAEVKIEKGQAQDRESQPNEVISHFGFSPNFFSDINNTVYAIERNPMRKISSASAVVQMSGEELSSKKALEAEDRELYQDEDSWSVSKHDSNSMTDSTTPTNNKITSISNEQILNLANIIQGLNVSQNRQVVKAYKSKLKTRFSRIYETNSQNYLENVKYKLFHKCCYPNCGRTFSSSGWLKAHFEEHLKELNKNHYNVLFDKFINSNKFIFDNTSKNNLFHYICNMRNEM